MTLPAARLMLALLICTLPSLGFAAETVSGADSQKPSLSQQAALPAEPPPLLQPAETADKHQPMRLGYVDMARIGTDSALGKALRVRAQETQKKFQDQLESKRKQLDKQKKALEEKFSTLTPAQREAKAKEFQKKVEDFQKFGMNAEKELQSLQDTLSTDFITSIEQAAVEYGKANGLTLVVVKRDLLYLASGVDAQDVTDGIIKLLNAKGKK